MAESTGAIAIDPAVVAELAAEVARTHPDKRMLVQYIQSHTSHLGGVNDRFKQCGISGVDDREEDDTYSVWEAVKNDLITHTELRESYIENLHIVEAECQRLCELLEGKTVITSDHGEHLSERKPVFRYYGHGYDTIENRQVPLLTVPYETRQRLTQDEPQGSHRRSEDEISDHLALLGYIE